MLSQTDKQRDIQAVQDAVDEYESYGDLRDKVIAFEEAVLNYAWDTYETSRSGMEGRRRQWMDDIERYRGKAEDAEEDTPFGKINPPKVARMVDIHMARTLQTIIPDRYRMDFFKFIPETDYMGQPPDPQVIGYAEAAQNAVRNDLINGNYIDELKRDLFNFYVLGNKVGMVVWETKICYRYRSIPNPEYDPAKPPEMNVRMNIVDGEMTFTPIPAEVMIREAYRSYDAPIYRSLNPLNVFPSELDVNNLTECSSVSIYDTVRLADLLEDEIKSGGTLYANLSQVHFADEREDVPEIVGGRMRDVDSTSYSMVDSARKLDRITLVGRFRPEEIFGEIGVEDEQERAALMEILSKKFGWDPTKESGWDTWIIEHVDEGSVLTRLQPLPYPIDEKPILHGQLFSVPNKTWAESLYDRVREEEIAANSMDRYQLEATLKMVRPPIMIIPDQLDSRWRLMNGDTYEYKPNMIFRGKRGAKINEVFQVMQYPTAPLNYAENAASMRALSMSEMAHLPPVKMGSASGGATASEINNMGSSSDIILTELCHAVERYVCEVLRWTLVLHHRLTRENRTGYIVDEAGEVQLRQVPPDVWIYQYRVNMTGFQQVGNMAIRAMNMKELITTLNAAGRLNADVAFTEYGKMLGVQNPASLVAPPPQPPPPLTEQLTLSYSMQGVQDPPSVRAKILEKVGVQLDAHDYSAMGDTWKAEQEAITAENTKEGQAVMGDGGPQGPGPNPDPSNGGSPSGVTEGGTRSHHAPGEVEGRQRGLHDAEGVGRSVAQQNRNPANSRRVQQS